MTTEIKYFKKAAAKVNYDPVTGVFTWKQPKFKNGNLRRPVGTKAFRWKTKRVPKGITLRVRLPNEQKIHQITLHRLAWFMQTGGLPNDQIDHINQNPFDNRWANLRDVSARVNCENKSNQSKYGVGVCLARGSRGRFHARARLGGFLTHIGTFNTAEEAAAARNARIKQYETEGS